MQLSLDAGEWCAGVYQVHECVVGGVTQLFIWGAAHCVEHILNKQICGRTLPLKCTKNYYHREETYIDNLDQVVYQDVSASVHVRKAEWKSQCWCEFNDERKERFKCCSMLCIPLEIWNYYNCFNGTNLLLYLYFLLYIQDMILLFKHNH